MKKKLQEAKKCISDIEDKILENNGTQQKRERIWNMRVDLGLSVTPSNIIIFIL